MELDFIDNDRNTYRECRRMLSKVKKWNRYFGVIVLSVSVFAPQYSALAVKAKAKEAKKEERKAATPLDAKAILDKVAKNMAADDEVAEVKMVTTEPGGDKSEKTLEIRRKGKDKGQKILVRLLAPAANKGIALLSKPDGDESAQWIYLPSNKQVRRLVGSGSSGKGGAFMGSELRNEDLGGDVKVTSTNLGNRSEGGKDYALIENMPKSESSYGKTILWVDTKDFLVGKVEYFDKAMKPLKVTEFRDYKKDGGAWRAQVIDVKNTQTKRGTRLELSKLQLNKGLSDSDFTESALTEGD